MSCNRRGICNCGRDACLDAMWWHAFLRAWCIVGYERYRDISRGEFTDADVDYLGEKS